MRFSAHAGCMTIRLGERAPAECRDMKESNNWHLGEMKAHNHENVEFVPRYNRKIEYYSTIPWFVVVPHTRL